MCFSKIVSTSREKVYDVKGYIDLLSGSGCMSACLSLSGFQDRCRNPERILLLVQNMFHARIGFLPLSWVNKGDCFNDYHPGQPSISQLFAMLSKSFCRPEGFTAAFQGRFVVSRQRILGQTLETYLYLLVSFL
jgi:hypothetical protein